MDWHNSDRIPLELWFVQLPWYHGIIFLPRADNPYFFRILHNEFSNCRCKFRRFPRKRFFCRNGKIDFNFSWITIDLLWILFWRKDLYLNIIIRNFMYPSSVVKQCSKNIVAILTTKRTNLKNFLFFSKVGIQDSDRRMIQFQPQSRLRSCLSCNPNSETYKSNPESRSKIPILINAYLPH